MKNLTRLFSPSSIVVVGASDKPGNLGAAVLADLRRLGFPGRVHVVHHSAAEIAGYRCVASLTDISDAVDMAILAVPAARLLEALRDCAAAGIRNGVAWASGFAEAGAEGRARQEEISRFCQEVGFNLCGPNCTGIVNSHLPFGTSFANPVSADGVLVAGDISIVSQSGTVAQFSQLIAEQHGFGFRIAISSGNEAVLSTADYIDALVDDAGTKVICLYLEGAKDGARLVEALRRARTAGKPVVALKSGSSAASAGAIQSHTGSLAGESRVWDAVLRDAGVIQVHSLEELVDIACLLSAEDLGKLPRGERVALLAFAGGTAVIGADLAEANGLSTPHLSEATVKRIADLLPPAAVTVNPMDLTPEAYQKRQFVERLPTALEQIAADPNIDAVVFQFGATSHPDLLKIVEDFRRSSGKLVVLSWLMRSDGVRQWLRERRIHAFSDISRALRALGRIASLRARAPDTADRPIHIAAGWHEAVGAIPRDGVISENVCNAALVAGGLPVAAGRLATDRDDVSRIVRDLGFPLVMKGISSAVTHRAAAKLLSLNLRSEEEALAAFARLTARAADIGVDLDGVFIQQMVAGEFELLVSGFSDPVFGPIVSCGAGGTMTELIDDVVLAAAPLNEVEARRLISGLRISRYLTSKQGETGIGPAAAFLARFSAVVATAPWRDFTLEVNPVKCSMETAIAVDSLLLVRSP